MAVPRQTLVLLRQLANQVGATTDNTVRTLAASWLAAWDRLAPAWQQAIAAIVDEYQRTGRWPAPWRTARIEAVARAQTATDRSLTALTAGASATTVQAAAVVSAATVAAEPGIIAAQVAGLAVAVPAAGLIAAVLAARTARIAALHVPLAAAGSAAVVAGLAYRPPGKNTDLQQVLFGRVRAGFDSVLTRAITVARTELVDTYREAAGLVHDANRQVLTGWAWHCVCDLRSCPACWSMHGRTFTLDVPGPEGHAGCRCTRLPLTAGASLPSAEARFRKLSRRDQTKVLGPGRWHLWHTGRVAWADLAVNRANKDWRDAIVPRTVADLRLLADTRQSA